MIVLKELEAAVLLLACELELELELALELEVLTTFFARC